MVQAHWGARLKTGQGLTPGPWKDSAFEGDATKANKRFSIGSFGEDRRQRGPVQNQRNWRAPDALLSIGLFFDILLFHKGLFKGKTCPTKKPAEKG